MRSLIFGGTGMLGRATVQEARRRGWPALALSHEHADITDDDRVAYWLEEFRPQVVFNCAAVTDVDGCEEDEEHAHAVNAEAVGRLAAVTEDAGAVLVQVSTDYVFGGEAEEPYEEDDDPRPLSVYGESKLGGERRALEHDSSLVVRSSWLFGPGGRNFVTTMIDLIEDDRTPLRVVADQVGCPTYTPFVARALCDLATVGASGLVHYRNRPAASWHEFADEIVRLWDLSVKVVPVSSEEFPRLAERPSYSVLAVERFEEIVGRQVEPWGWGLAEYLTDMRVAEESA